MTSPSGELVFMAAYANPVYTEGPREGEDEELVPDPKTPLKSSNSHLSPPVPEPSTAVATVWFATPLEQARTLRNPTYNALLRRDPYVAYFWQRYGGLLKEAWAEWEAQEVAKGALPALLEASILRPEVVRAFEGAWDDVSKEGEVRKLWEEVAPGVFRLNFFDPSKTHILREYLAKVAQSGIPYRPPYGITLNRKGFILDERSDGYLAIPGFQKFYRELVDKYMRPSGRLLYPEYVSSRDDSNSFAFTIQYQRSTETESRQHSDASALTFSINMNMHGEEYTGSLLYFVDPITGEKKKAVFGLGDAILHRGATRRAALPITSGLCSTIVLWLYGENGFNYYPYSANEQLTAQERWTKPSAKSKGTWGWL